MITVLVVDDDFRVARIHSAFVDRVDGFGTVGSAGTGREALEQARRLRPDLILLDLYLPDIFGLDLLIQLRVAGVEGDAIVISAANESETVERALKLGVANYLLKPFTFDELANRLNEYRAQRSRRPQPLVRQPGGGGPDLRPTRIRAANRLAQGSQPRDCGADPGLALRRTPVGSGVRRRSRHLPGQCSAIPGALCTAGHGAGLAPLWQPRSSGASLHPRRGRLLGGWCQTMTYCAAPGHAPGFVVVVADRTPLSDSSSASPGTHPSTCSLRPPFDTTLLAPCSTCTILDDYADVARSFADWDRLPGVRRPDRSRPPGGRRTGPGHRGQRDRGDHAGTHAVPSRAARPTAATSAR